MQQLGEIRVSGGRRLTVDIEGIIGAPDGQSCGDETARAATYESFRSQIDRIGRSGARKVQVNIRSAGGDVNDALLIYDALCALAAEGAEITTSCHGYTASAATVIAQAATPGRRLVSANALYLIHNSHAAIEGNSFDVERTGRLLDKTDERIAEIYAARSGRPVEQFRELMARDGGRGEWLSAAETVAAGLADRVSRPSPLAVVRDRVADTVRNLFRSPLPAVDEAVRPGGMDGATALAASAACVGDPAQGPETVALRQAVRATATQPCEDPAVIPAGMTVGNTGDEYSRNGIAYENDAVRLRSGC